MRISLIIATCLLAAGSAQAANADLGKDKAATVCASCHGADGKSSNGQYPILAGQHKDYLIKALKDYQSGARNNAIMAGMAKPLSKAEIESLAAWFASQSGPLNMSR
ncbi:c-type cytochrome [Parachitinimonas caeni]|uniref:Cytochrome c n=1 Tax=Parachitinimonas caeni TaxID=3031301 RepID=A0ABT7DVC0_9NEIS|nr:cytochrome c [Parachitinimonas caeni]MDK2123038.1 cytochrome c [Parachitinimonas caeni]